MLETSGVRGTRSALARSFERDPNFVKLTGPALGCIVTFWRGSKKSGLGHVGFYNGTSGDYVSTLGGNEGDMVKVELYRAVGSKFGMSGFYWPKSVPLPSIGKIPPQSASAIGTGKVT